MKITGIMIYYCTVCKRKLWYSCKKIELEYLNENVQIGKALDESAYGKEDKHINIRDEINIDFIKEKRIIHEVKKSKKIEEASIWQVKYYIYYLEKEGVDGVTGQIDYPLIRKTKEVLLTQEDKCKLDGMIEEIKRIINLDSPPKMKKLAICKNCAYHDLCWI